MDAAPSNAAGTAGGSAAADADGSSPHADATDANGKHADYVDSAIATTNSMHFGTATTTATGAHYQFNSLNL